jgi:hypothetical protein
MDSSKDNCSVPREELPRASAVIVASRPLERPESVTVLGEDQQVLPALLRIGRISLIERLIIRLQTVGIAPLISKAKKKWVAGISQRFRTVLRESNCA